MSAEVGPELVFQSVLADSGPVLTTRQTYSLNETLSSNQLTTGNKENVPGPTAQLCIVCVFHFGPITEMVTEQIPSL
jgi:hypothetical protein